MHLSFKNDMKILAAINLSFLALTTYACKDIL